MSNLPVGLRQWQSCRAIIASIVGLTSLACAGPAYAGYASMVIDAGTGEVLNEVNADALNHPASLTKMMTLYLTFEALRAGRISMDQAVPVSEFAASKSPTKLGLVTGETVTVRECVLGMIVLSANDAAAVMAEALGNGSETSFARMMTEKAHALGMTNTVFHNASGLPDEGQVTTARDLVKLSLALYKTFPEQYRYFKTREYTFRGRIITGHNHFLDEYEGADGIKTGFINASGYNLAASAERDHRRLIGVVMGGATHQARDHLMATLFDNGFAHRQTDPVLVASAGGQDTAEAREIVAGAQHLAAALTPVSRAEAAPAHAPAPTRQIQTAGVTEGWSIQIGGFAHAGQAEQAALSGIKLAALRGVQASILTPERHDHNRAYRAKFAGFTTEHQARTACFAVVTRGHACTILPPQRAGVRLASAT